MKKFISLALLSLLVFNIIAIGTVAAQPTEKVPVLIEFNGKPDAALVRAFGGEIKFEYNIIPAIAASLPPQAIDALQRNPNIASIELDGVVHATEDYQWGVTQIGADFVHQGGNSGQGVVVAILDTGIDYTHPDLDANYGGGKDFINNDDDPIDDNGHGTHCAGIVAAENNGVGVIGVAPSATLMAVKVLDAGGSGYYSTIIAGINYAVLNGAKIISMSLGGDSGSTTLQSACDAAFASNVLVVAAAGNDYQRRGRTEMDTVDYPGRYDSVIAVGATDQNNVKASFSSTGPTVEITAPGVSILSTYPGGYATGSGTSMATPHVAGVAALIFASDVQDATTVRTLLQTTADDLGSIGRDTWYGYGLVDADEAASEPDTTPPSKVEGLTVGDVTYNQVNLAWSANSEEDFDYYKVYRDGVLVDTTAMNAFLDTGLAELTTYTYTVSAVDTSNNEGLVSDEAVATTLEAPPVPDIVVTVADPVLHTRKAGPNIFIYATVTVEVTTSDNVPVAGATVSGHWTGATSDTEIGTTSSEGTVVFQSDSVKNDPGATFTLVVDNVMLP